MDKRGVSPLVATLVLILLAVAMGIAVMNFGRAQIEVNAQCSINTGIRPVEIKGQKQVCTDGNVLKILVENGPVIPIRGLRIRIIGENDIVTASPESAMDVDGAVDLNVEYDTELNGPIRQIKITPEIEVYDEVLICPEQAIIIEDVFSCG